MSDEESHEQRTLLDHSINGTSEAQLENRNQPYPNDWEEIAVKMLKKRLWSALEAANMLCGLHPSRISYAPWEGNASDMDRSLKYFKDHSDPRPWKLDEVEKNYGKVRRELERVIADGEIEVFDQSDWHKPMSAILDRDEVLIWAKKHLKTLPEVFSHQEPSDKRTRPERAKKHAEKRDSTWLAIATILIEEGPKKYLHQDGTLNVSRITARVEVKAGAFFNEESNLLDVKTISDQYREAKKSLQNFNKIR